MISRKGEIGEWRLDGNISYYLSVWDARQLHLLEEWDFTGRIKYCTDTNGKVEVMFEVTYDMVCRGEKLTRGHLWWKDTYYAPDEVKTKTKWLYDWSFNFYTYPTQVIYECTTTGTPDGDSCCENHW